MQAPPRAEAPFVGADGGLESEDREELRARARKALSATPSNDYIKGYQSAWAEILGVMNMQDDMRRRMAVMDGCGSEEPPPPMPGRR